MTLCIWFFSKRSAFPPPSQYIDFEGQQQYVDRFNNEIVSVPLLSKKYFQDAYLNSLSHVRIIYCREVIKDFQKGLVSSLSKVQLILLFAFRLQFKGRENSSSIDSGDTQNWSNFNGF